MSMQTQVLDFDAVTAAQEEAKKSHFFTSFNHLNLHNGFRKGMLHGYIGTAGCLTGDAEVIINRGGNATRYKLGDLCRSFGEYPGSKKTLRENIPNKTRSYIEKESRIGLRDFCKVIYSGVQDVFLLKLRDGKSVKATADHKIMTKRGMVPLIELTSSDEVMVDDSVTPKRTMVKPKKTLDRNENIGRHHPFSRRRTDLRKGGREYWTLARHRAVYDAKINGISLKELKERTKTPDHGLFCIDPAIYDVHHINGNHYDNDPANLIHLTKEHHRSLHGSASIYRNFSQGEPAYSTVESVTFFGTEDVFDLYEVDETHNFVANGIVVSNCGKSSLMKPLALQAVTGSEPYRALYWLSEEHVSKYGMGIQRYSERRGSPYERIRFFEERNLDHQILSTHENFLCAFREIVERECADIVFIDNVTSSRFYGLKVGLQNQAKTVDFLVNMAQELNIPIVYMAHTKSNVTDNMGRLINKEDVRGPNDITIQTQYLYILQKFTQNGTIFLTGRTEKARDHQAAFGSFVFQYDPNLGVYVGDVKVDFAQINEIFKGRDHLGKR